jgi:hypothetical protein
MNNTNLEQTIAELEFRRVQIDMAIDALRRVVMGPVTTAVAPVPAAKAPAQPHKPVVSTPLIRASDYATDAERRVLTSLTKVGKPMRAVEIVADTTLLPYTVKTALKQLAHEKRVVLTGSTSQARWSLVPAEKKPAVGI